MVNQPCRTSHFNFLYTGRDMQRVIVWTLLIALLGPVIHSSREAAACRSTTTDADAAASPIQIARVSTKGGIIANNTGAINYLRSFFFTNGLWWYHFGEGMLRARGSRFFSLLDYCSPICCCSELNIKQNCNATEQSRFCLVY